MAVKEKAPIALTWAGCRGLNGQDVGPAPWVSLRFPSCSASEGHMSVLALCLSTELFIQWSLITLQTLLHLASSTLFWHKRLLIHPILWSEGNKEWRQTAVQKPSHPWLQGTRSLLPFLCTYSWGNIKLCVSLSQLLAKINDYAAQWFDKKNYP